MSIPPTERTSVFYPGATSTLPAHPHPHSLAVLPTGGVRLPFSAYTQHNKPSPWPYRYRTAPTNSALFLRRLSDGRHNPRRARNGSRSSHSKRRHRQMPTHGVNAPSLRAMPQTLPEVSQAPCRSSSASHSWPSARRFLTIGPSSLTSSLLSSSKI